MRKLFLAIAVLFICLSAPAGAEKLHLPKYSLWSDTQSVSNTEVRDFLQAVGSAVDYFQNVDRGNRISLTASTDTEGFWYITPQDNTATGDAEDNGSKARDLSFTFTTGAHVNIPTKTAGSKLGARALAFNGVDEYVNHGKDITNTDNFGASIWVKFDTGGIDGSVISYIVSRFDGSANEGWAVGVNGTFTELTCASGGENYAFLYYWDDGASAYDYVCDTTTALVDGTWYLITATVDSNTAKISVNDNTWATKASADIVEADAVDLWTGARSDGLLYADATLDDLRLYTTAIDATERGVIYNSGSGVECETSTTLLCFNYNETSGLTAFTDQVVPFSALSIPHSRGTSLIWSYFHNALSTDITANDVSAYVKFKTPDTLDGNYTLIGAPDSSDATVWRLYIDSTDKLTFEVVGNNETKSIQSAALSAGTWYTAVARFDATGSTLDLRHNSTTVTQVSTTNTAIATVADLYVGVGNSTRENPYTGIGSVVSEVGVYSVVLTDTETSWLTNAGKGRKRPLTYNTTGNRVLGNIQIPNAASITSISWVADEQGTAEIEYTSGQNDIRVKCASTEGGLAGASWVTATNGQDISGSCGGTTEWLQIETTLVTTTADRFKTPRIYSLTVETDSATPCAGGYTSRQLFVDNADSASFASGSLVSFKLSPLDITPDIANWDDVRVYQKTGGSGTELDRDIVGDEVVFKTQDAIPAYKQDASYYLCTNNTGAGAGPNVLANIYDSNDTFTSLAAWTETETGSATGAIVSNAYDMSLTTGGSGDHVRIAYTTGKASPIRRQIYDVCFDANATDSTYISTGWAYSTTGNYAARVDLYPNSNSVVLKSWASDGGAVDTITRTPIATIAANACYTIDHFVGKNTQIFKIYDASDILLYTTAGDLQEADEVDTNTLYATIHGVSGTPASATTITIDNWRLGKQTFPGAWVEPFEWSKCADDGGTQPNEVIETNSSGTEVWFRRWARLFKSTDSCNSLPTEIFDFGTEFGEFEITAILKTQVGSLIVATNYDGHLYRCPNGSDCTLKASWTLVRDNAHSIPDDRQWTHGWQIDEDSSGRIIAGQYGIGELLSASFVGDQADEVNKMFYLRSTDDGATWSIIYRIQDGDVHLHMGKINKKDTPNRIYISSHSQDTGAAVAGFGKFKADDTDCTVVNGYGCYFGSPADSGTVQTSGGGCTNSTSVVKTDITGDGDDFWNGSFLRFKTGANQYQEREVTDYVSTTGCFTLEATYLLPSTPSATETLDVATIIAQDDNFGMAAKAGTLYTLSDDATDNKILRYVNETGPATAVYEIGDASNLDSEWGTSLVYNPDMNNILVPWQQGGAGFIHTGACRTSSTGTTQDTVSWTAWSVDDGISFDQIYLWPLYRCYGKWVDVSPNRFTRGSSLTAYVSSAGQYSVPVLSKFSVSTSFFLPTLYRTLSGE